MSKMYKILLLLLLANTVYAQLPGIPYQAVVLSRDAGQELPGVDDNSVNLLRNSTVSIKFTVFDQFQNVEYSEYHDSVLVDGYGMLNLVVGDGIALINEFKQINWDLTQKWLDVDIDFDGGFNFTDLDYISLRIIPYDNDGQQLSLEDSVLILENGSSVDLRPLLQFQGGEGSDDQNISGSSLSGTDLTIGIEDGTSEDVSLIGLASDSAFVTTLASDSIFAATLVNDSNFVTSLATDSLFNTTLAMDTNFIANLDSLISAGTDDQNISGSSLSGTDLIIGIENGTSEIIDLSSLVTGLDTVYSSNDSLILVSNGLSDTTVVDLGGLADTDDQQLSIDGDSLRLQDGGAVSLNSLGSDDQNISGSGLSGSDLTIGIEDGTSEDVSLIGLASDSAFVTTLASDSIFAATLVNDSNFVTSLATDSLFNTTLAMDTNFIANLDSLIGSDDQNISGSSLSGSDLTIGIEDGTSEDVSLIGLASDSAFVTTLASDSIFAATLVNDSNFVTSLATDSLFNTTLAMDTNFIANLDSLIGSDDQNISGSSLSGTDLIIGIENGTSEIIDLSSLVTGLDTVYSSNDSLILVSNGFNDTTVVDLGGLADTDDQQLSIDGDSLRLQDGGAVSLDSLGSDDQNISGSGLSGSDLTIGIEDGTSEDVSLLALASDSAFVTTLASDSIFAATLVNDSNFVTSLATDSLFNTTLAMDTNFIANLDSLIGSDDQNISGSSLSGTDLTIGIEDGTSEDVSLIGLASDSAFVTTLASDSIFAATLVNDSNFVTSLATDSLFNTTLAMDTNFIANLDSLIGSDDQNISGSSLSGSDLTIGIEDGTSEDVSLIGLASDSTFVTTLASDSIFAATLVNDSNFVTSLATDSLFNTTLAMDTNFIANLDSLISAGTDDQNISGSGLSGSDLTIGIEDGTSEDVSLLALASDSAFVTTLASDSIFAATLVNDSNFVTSLATDSLFNTTLAMDTNFIANLDSLIGSDDQNISGSSLSGSDLTIGIEDGTSEDVSLLALASDSAFVTTLASDSIFAATLVNDSNFVTSLATDSLFNTTLAMDTNFIANLDSLIGSDDQNISGSSLSGTDLTIGIEDGTSEDVSLIGLASDSAFVTTLASDSIFAATLVNDSNFVTSLATDSLFNTTLAMDTNFIANLDSLIGSDDQNISGSSLSGSDLTIGIEDGTSEDVSLIGLASDSTFVTTLASDSIFAATLVNDSNFVTSLATDSLFNTTLAMDTNFIANLDSLIGSDDQNISGSSLSGTDLTIGIEDGTSEDVSLIGLASDSAFVTTLASDSIFAATLVNDSNFVTSLATDSLFNTTLAMDTNFIANLDSLISAGTDDQNISGSSLSGTDLIIGIENGTSEIIDLSSLATGLDTVYSSNDSLILVSNGLSDTTVVDLGGLADTDDQQLSIDGDSLRLQDGGAVSLDSLGSDDQNISGSSLSGTDLTIGIEDGTSEDVSLIGLASDSAFVTTLASDSIFAATLVNDSNFVTSLATDSLFNTTLAMDTNFIANLDSLIGSDDQNISGSSLSGSDLTIGIEDGTSEDVSLIGLASDSTFVTTLASDSIFAATLVNDSNFVTSLATDSLFNTTLAMDTNFIANLDSLIGSDDQNISGSSLSGSDLTIGIEDGTSEDVSLIGLASDSTFVTTLASDSIFAATLVNDSNFVTSLATDSLFNTTLAMDTNFIANLDSLIGSDDQNISGSSLSGTDLTIGIEDGTSEDVSLIGLASDSAFVTTLASDSIFAATLVNDSNFVTSLATDSLFNTTLAMDTNFIANLDSLIGSDDQNISGSSLSGSDLTIGIEDGTSEDVSLIGLASDSAFVTTLASDSIFAATLVNDSNFVTSLATDSLFNTTLAMDTNFIANLDSLISAGTDDQNISGSSLSGTDLIIGIENGTSEIIDLSSLATGLDTVYSSNDSLILVSNGLSDTTVVDLGGLADTDDQQLSIDGDSLRLQDGGAVSLDSLGDGDAWAVNGEDTISSIGRVGNVGVGTISPATTLDVAGLNSATTGVLDSTDGVLVPRVTTDMKDSPVDGTVEGQLVYSSNALSKGFYFWNGTTWQTVQRGSARVTTDPEITNADLNGYVIAAATVIFDLGTLTPGDGDVITFVGAVPGGFSVAGAHFSSTVAPFSPGGGISYVYDKESNTWYSFSGF